MSRPAPTKISGWFVKSPPPSSEEDGGQEEPPRFRVHNRPPGDDEQADDEGSRYNSLHSSMDGRGETRDLYLMTREDTNSTILLEYKKTDKGKRRRVAKALNGLGKLLGRAGKGFSREDKSKHSNAAESLDIYRDETHDIHAWDPFRHGGPKPNRWPEAQSWPDPREPKDFNWILPVSGKQQNVALWGPEGSRKTWVARQLVRRVPPECFVFWVEASDRNSFIQHYKELADQLVEPGKHIRGVMAAVREAMEALPQVWLLVINDADDLSLFGVGDSAEVSDSLLKYIPNGPGGTVLWTTRDERIRHIVGPQYCLQLGDAKPGKADLPDTRAALAKFESGITSQWERTSEDVLPLVLKQPHASSSRPKILARETLTNAEYSPFPSHQRAVQLTELERSKTTQKIVQVLSEEDGSSDMSDQESLDSDAATAIVSVTPFAIGSETAREEVKHLLFSHAKLQELYAVAGSRMLSHRFRRNLNRLLQQFGQSLQDEAATVLQQEVAGFIRHSSSRLAFEVAFLKTPGLNRLTSARDDSRLQEDADASGMQSGDEDPKLAASSGVDNMEEFIVESKAFQALVERFSCWLRLKNPTNDSTDDGHSDPTTEERELTTDPNVTKPQDMDHNIDSTPPHEQDLGKSSLPRCVWVDLGVRRLVAMRNVMLDLMQLPVAPGRVRVSWTCRCGKRLRINASKTRKEAVVAFAQQASDPLDSSIIIESSDSDNSSSSTSSGVSNGGHSSQSSLPPRRSPAPELSVDDPPDPFISAGTKKYMLLCNNTGTRLIKLDNVDVTDISKDEKIFSKLREAYSARRGMNARLRLVKPKRIHYVKFQLLNLAKSGDCVVNYEVNQIPSRKEIIDQKYAFSPCPPPHGPLPIPPDILMHIFLTPGDHLGSMAAEMLPKKLHEELLWDNRVNSVQNLPMGWGFYIVQGINRSLIAWVVAFLSSGTILLTILWSAIRGDVQGGTGIGSFCMGTLAISVAVLVWDT